MKPLSIFAFALGAMAQCNNLVLNPITGKLDCTSGGGTGSNGTALSIPSATYSTGNWYFPPGGGGPGSATEASAPQGLVTVAGNINNLGVSVSANPGSSTLAFTFRDNAAGKTVTCSLTSATKQCSDTTHNDAVIFNDLIDWQMAVSGASYTGAIYISWGTPTAGIPSTAVTSVNARPGPTVVLTKADINLANVQNLDQTLGATILTCCVGAPVGGTGTAPGASLPGTCTVGQIFFDTAATAGQNLYLCTSTNTFTQIVPGGSSTAKCVKIAAASYSAGNTTVTDNMNTASPYQRDVKWFDSGGDVLVGYPQSGWTNNTFVINLSGSESSMWGISCGVADGSTGSISPSSAGPYTDTEVVASPTFACSGCAASTWGSSGLSGSGLSVSGASSSAPLSGTAVAGTYAGASVSYGVVNSGSFTVQVNAKPSTTTCGGTGPPSCPGATVGSAYSAAVATTGGTGAVTTAVTSGSMPTGLSLSGNTISGTPSGAITTYTFAITATDSHTIAGTPVTYTIVLSAAPTCAITPTSLSAMTDTQVVAGITFTSTGGGCAGAWSIVGQPSALNVSGSAGTTSLAGTVASGAHTSSPYAAITITRGSTNQAISSLTVNAVPSITACGSGTVSSGAATCDSGTAGTPYSENVASTGGTPTVTYAIASGGSTLTALSLSMAGNGTISGTPTAGTATFTVVATDGNSVASSGVVMTLVVSGGVHTAPTFVQANECQTSTATSQACSFVSPPTVGDLVCVTGIQNYGGGGSPTFGTPTDNQTGNTYTVLGSFAGAGAGQKLACVLVVGSSGTFTITVSSTAGGGANVIASVIVDYTPGTLTSLTPDTTCNINGNTSCNLVTTNAYDLLVAGAGNPSVENQFWTAGSGFTQRYPSSSQGLYQGGYQDRAVTSTGTYTVQWGCSPSFNCPDTPQMLVGITAAALKY